MQSSLVNHLLDVVQHLVVSLAVCFSSQSQSEAHTHTHTYIVSFMPDGLALNSGSFNRWTHVSLTEDSVQCVRVLDPRDWLDNESFLPGSPFLFISRAAKITTSRGATCLCVCLRFASPGIHRPVPNVLFNHLQRFDEVYVAL